MRISQSRSGEVRRTTLLTGGLLTTEKALDEANQPILKGAF
jgi:hypothetical protein